MPKEKFAAIESLVCLVKTFSVMDEVSNIEVSLIILIVNLQFKKEENFFSDPKID